MCFDCSSKETEWASVNNAIFLCKECQLKHRSYGVSISYIRSLEMDLWKEEQVNMLLFGGNERLKDLLSLYSVKYNTERSELYFSKLLDYHRKLIKSELKGDQRPQPPNDEEALLPFEKSEAKVYKGSSDENENSSSSVHNINNYDNSNQDFVINQDPPKQVNDDSYTGMVTGFMGGLWSTTKDVASEVKNKVDKSGVLEQAKAKSSQLLDQAKESGAMLANKGMEYGKYGYEKSIEYSKYGVDKGKELGMKGVEIGVHKYDEVKTKGLTDTAVSTSHSIYDSAWSGFSGLKNYVTGTSSSEQKQDSKEEPGEKAQDNKPEDIEIQEIKESKEESNISNINKDF
eukprot:CAMPEP_0170519922 /NCGR_PEP_ID=MMETSP0209-20121228/5153_1 /TAXON_ID=665100 ORGANISM="Litonotus pictus, Strain P1" /NCGR_SAMPLE_ID=MMETSP0209 /ASSEMBLY_ACC=CAM_ASM_000301 /LENGTH=343 /DNA_ID=CAMNT_0010805917 /DNA_START=43 /DNA_END=1074 /DNA_ORIENTATION=-